MFLMFLLVRLAELFLIQSINATSMTFWEQLQKVFVVDVLVFFNLQVVLCLPLILLGIFFDFRVVNFFMYLLLAILVFTYILLIFYFKSTLNPLGAEFLDYTYEDIRQTVGAADVLNVYTIIGSIVLLIFILWIPQKFMSIEWPSFLVLIYFTFAFSSIFLSGYAEPNSKNFNKVIDHQIVQNKLRYFSNSLAEKSFTRSSIAYDGFYFDDDFAANSTKYIDPDNYPFLHRDSTADVLSPYFNRFDTTPNIVFIIIEGMGRTYSGREAEFGSFTPFLDSLSEHSLYWDNFLSNGGRTFAVLPSMFASLPFSKNGFMELGNAMPEHLSLLRIAKQNGYRTSFFHGGDLSFDKMDIFLKRQKIDLMVGLNDYPQNFKTMPKSSNGFTWGYGDKEVFRNYFLVKDQEKKSAPRIDVFLTLSTHNPFKIDNQQYYIDLFYKRLQSIGIDENGKKKYEPYKEMYSTIMYTDDAIRNFINEYKKRSDFKNTIFVITGDHRMPEIPLNSNLDRFHVPLIIYSPNLKRTAYFKGVSSQLDIAPTFLAYLRLNYGLKKSMIHAWVGSNLDTSRYFNSQKFIPLKRNKNEFGDYVDRGLYYSMGQFYKINDYFKQSEADDQIAIRLAQAKYEEYCRKRDITFNSNKILPDSVLNFKIDK